MFCRNCGARLPEESRFCAACGAPIQTAAPAAPPAAAAPTVPGAESKVRRHQKSIRLLSIFSGILVALLGLGYSALTLAGAAATARVTGYEQALFLNTDDSSRNSSRYKLSYEFSVDGERYTGSVTRTFANGGQMRQAIAVRYLPFWPHINAEDNDGTAFVGPVMVAAGILMVVFEVKRKPKMKRKA